MSETDMDVTKIKAALARLRESEPPWFYEHAYTPDGLSRVDDGRSSGLFSFNCEAHVAEAICAVMNDAASLLAAAEERDRFRAALEDAAAIGCFVENITGEAGPCRQCAPCRARVALAGKAAK